MADFISKFNNILGQTSQAIGVADSVGDLIGVPNIASRILGSQSPRAQFSISKMNSALNQYDGVLKSSLFLARISPPLTMEQSVSQDLIMFCDNANLPNVQIAANDEIVRSGYGPTESMPYKPMFGDIQLGFLADGRGLTHTFFQEWINSIVPFDLRKGFSATDGGGRSPFEVEYKQNYQGQIQICAYNVQQQNIIEVEAFEAYPSAIDDVQLNWNNTDDIMRMSVRFKFSYYVSKSTEPMGLGGLFSGGGSFFNMLMKGASIVQTISTLKKPQSIGDVANVVQNANIIKRGVFGNRRV